MDFFTATDTANASTFLRSVNQTDGSFSERFLMPITGFENNGQPVVPKGFEKSYGLYLTIEATGKGTMFDSLNLTLWADPKANDGTPSVSEISDPSFSNGTRGDFALAHGTLASATLMQDATGTRHANFVEDLTPTLAGTLLSGGSLRPDTLLQEQLTSPASVLTATPQADGTTVNLLQGGTAKISAPSFNAVQYQNNLFSIVQPDSTFVSHRIDPITGFTLNGKGVVPDGFGTSYGLYFDITDTGNSTPTSLSFTSSTFKLMYDPENQNGAVTATSNGIGFDNTGANGAADDIELGSGTFVSGVAGVDPSTGFRTTHFVENFVPIDQAGLSPFVNSPAMFDFLNSGSAVVVNTPQSDGTIVQTFNGASDGVATSVPEIGDGTTVLVPNISSEHFHPRMGFLHGHHHQA
jgi:hypothetical protein